MKCPDCGSEMHPDIIVCRDCGEAVIAGSGADFLNKFSEHLRTSMSDAIGRGQEAEDKLADALEEIRVLKSRPSVEICKKERAAGNGRCGACALCCHEANEKLLMAQAELKKLAHKIKQLDCQPNETGDLCGGCTACLERQAQNNLMNANQHISDLENALRDCRKEALFSIDVIKSLNPEASTALSAAYNAVDENTAWADSEDQLSAHKKSMEDHQ